MSAHTPGPWHKERNNSPHSVYPYRIRHRNADGSTRDIGECWHLEDARLIAKAPAMREALELAEATIARLNRHDSANGTLDVIRAALGGTP